MKTAKLKSKFLFDYKLSATILLCFLTRHPFSFTNEFLLNVNECIADLMTKHFSGCNGILCFFYGKTNVVSFTDVAYWSKFEITKKLNYE